MLDTESDTILRYNVSNILNEFIWGKEVVQTVKIELKYGDNMHGFVVSIVSTDDPLPLRLRTYSYWLKKQCRQR